MKCGAKHSETPSSVPRLVDVANLTKANQSICNWLKGVDTSGNLGNDIAPNCVQVAILRSIQIRIFHSMGSGWIPTTEQAYELYVRQNGVDPLSPQADGTDTVESMKDWITKGVRVNDSLLDVPSWFSLDPKNLDHLKQVIELTGSALVTFNLPAALQEDGGPRSWSFTPDGSPAKVAGSWTAHRVCIAGFEQNGFFGTTWGVEELPISNEFFSAYAIGADAVIDWDWFETTGLSVPGLSKEALIRSV